MAKQVIKNDFKKAELKYPKIKLFWEEDNFICKGNVDVFDEMNVYWDSFNIKIVINIKKYPYYFPVVYLEDARIPKNEERHIHSDNSCCVEVEQKQSLRARKGITILQFLDEYVVPYFANQLYFEKEKVWANGDYQHGFDGKLQDYFEMTGIKNLVELQYLLSNLEKTFNLKMYEVCFCGSGKKLKYCHKESLKKILSLPKTQIENDLNAIESMMSKR